MELSDEQYQYLGAKFDQKELSNEQRASSSEVREAGKVFAEALLSECGDNPNVKYQIDDISRQVENAVSWIGKTAAEKAEHSGGKTLTERSTAVSPA